MADEDFGDAFTRLSAIGDNPPDPAPAEPAPAEPVAAEPAEPAPAEPVAAEPEPAPAEPAPAEPAPAEPAPDLAKVAEDVAAEPTPAELADAAPTEPAPAQDTEALIKRFEGLIESQEAKKVVEPAPAPVAEPAAPETPLYNDEEKTYLEEYKKQWGDVVKGEGLQRREEYKFLTEWILGEVMRVVAPLSETVDTLANNIHFQDLNTRVPDFDDVADKLEGWVDKQPDYLQKAYKDVIAQGTAAQVADLVTRYRQENGAPPVGKVPPKGDPVTPTKPTELPAQAKQAADALAPVSTKRSQNAIADPQSFEQAFAIHAKETAA